MDSSNQLLLPISIVLLLGIWACGLVWSVVVVRLVRGAPVVRYEPRRPVPWFGIDLFAVALLAIAVPVLTAAAGRKCFGIEDGVPAAVDEGAPDTGHPIGRLLMGDQGGWVFALCALAAVVVAPLVEEFLFRLVFQGWLEAVERGRRPRTSGRRATAVPPGPPAEPVDPANPYVSPAGEVAAEAPRGFAHAVRTRRRVLPIGVLPIFISSLLFAALHFRPSEPAQPLEQLVFLLVMWQVSSLLVFILAAGLLRFRSGATLKDFGIVPGKLLPDVRLGLVAYVAVCPPVYLLMFLVKSVAPETWVVDPFPLFFFAIALGFLYFRTHRIVPSIVTHAAFNGTTVFLAWLATG